MLSRSTLPVLLGVTVLTLSACGSSKDSTASTPATTPTAAVTAAAKDGLTAVKPRTTAGSAQICLTKAGARIDSVADVGSNAVGVYAELPAGTMSMIAVGDTAADATDAVEALRDLSDYSVNTTEDPRVFVVFKGDIKSSDRAVAARCVKPPAN